MRYIITAIIALATLTACEPVEGDDTDERPYRDEPESRDSDTHEPDFVATEYTAGCDEGLLVDVGFMAVTTAWMCLDDGTCSAATSAYFDDATGDLRVTCAAPYDYARLVVIAPSE